MLFAKSYKKREAGFQKWKMHFARELVSVNSSEMKLAQKER